MTGFRKDFPETAGKDPARYLAGCHWVTLEVLADLFGQAQFAGAIAGCSAGQVSQTSI